MRVFTETLELQTRGRGLYRLDRELQGFAGRCGLKEGLVTLFIQHTSASLLVQENADPDVQGDLERFFARLVRDGDGLFQHTAEGPDDMPAHVRAALTQTQLSLPVSGGRWMLGTWQGVYVWEHRLAAHRRKVVAQYLGE